MVKVPSSGKVEYWVTRPRPRAAVAVASLNVEPGAYWPAMARLFSGDRLAGSWRAAKLAWEMPPTNCDGSYVGYEAIASTEPLRGSRTTSDPAGATKCLPL